MEKTELFRMILSDTAKYISPEAAKNLEKEIGKNIQDVKLTKVRTKKKLKICLDTNVLAWIFFPEQSHDSLSLISQNTSIDCKHLFEKIIKQEYECVIPITVLSDYIRYASRTYTSKSIIKQQTDLIESTCTIIKITVQLLHNMLNQMQETEYYRGNALTITLASYYDAVLITYDKKTLDHFKDDQISKKITIRQPSELI